VSAQDAQACPGWHHWRYEQQSGKTFCREHGREVPQEERDAPMRPVAG
jgi:hypothetical protein